MSLSYKNMTSASQSATNQKRAAAEEAPDFAPKVVVLTALQLEYKAVRRFLSGLIEETHSSGTVYEKGVFERTDGSSIQVGLVEIGAGNAGAAVEAERAIQHFDPHVILFVGIAGGLKDVQIGDVVVGTKVYGYDSGKAKQQFEPRPSVRNTSYRLEQRARAEAKKSNWLGRIQDRNPEQSPSVKIGPIAAGEKVLASTRSAVAKFLKQHYGDAIAIEMEGRGFLEAAHVNQHVEALIIRGISDLIDQKAKADRSGSQLLAAGHAAAFAFEILAKLDFAPQAIPPKPTAIMPNATSTLPPGEPQPHTLVISQMGKGDFNSITEALKQIGAGERLLIKPGLYEEHLLIDKTIELVGEGLPGDVVIQSKSSATVVFRAPMGRISNISFRQLNPDSDACVSIVQGRLELEGCDVSGKGKCAIAISGGADPRLKSNFIHDSAGAGVVLTESARGTLEDNRVAFNAQAGIEIFDGASPTVRNNQIFDGTTAGIFVYGNGIGYIEDNDIWGNQIGIYVKGPAFPRIHRNSIHTNVSNGIQLEDGAKVVITENELIRNQQAISVFDSNATIRKNRVGNCGTGITVYGKDSQATIEDNELFGHGNSAISVTFSAVATVRGNDIHDSNSFGIRFHGAAGTVEDNRIRRTALPGVMITKSRVDVRRNRFLRCRRAAIDAGDGSDGWIEDNVFSSNKLNVNKAEGSKISLGHNREIKRTPAKQ